ncbi:styrene monooxygenase/indole monooxygenase family protein [Planosporangium mesophilum]|uniref:Alanine-phosphoribitol ligase n=1 Tax=Planosporangium mesophilum TaxID=689768 RepID=A0A8J3THL3_9ACTN|nr:styrene monooxygenase/indole monooxygenase family protein [Planosporangium mesophilum]NJC85977.1 FAD-binding oxidoreductase [Planosporangium mesophilum]GII25922.1 alanine-phosphoribitol ligase [Planosporangium mesophilum]
MRRILIVGAGQSGLQLGLSLLAEGYDVTIMSARTPDEIRRGWVMSTQAMFDVALQSERKYGLNLWEDETPRIEGLHVSLSAPPGERALRIPCPLDAYAQSTDQRVKMAAWLELFEQRGGTVHYQGVTTADLDGLTTMGRYDLTIVAAGKGDLVSAFDRDPDRSPYTAPQRGLAVAYVHGMTPDPTWPVHQVSFNAVPGLGELFVMPSYTLSGPCEILFWETVPDGPLDQFKERLDPAEHLKRTLDLMRRYTPWIYERALDVELTDGRATLSGRYTPTVRRPVADLPGGGLALGMADVVVANDPITGQGSNTAAKCAYSYLQSILAHGDQPFDRSWMEQTFELFWEGTGRAVVDWTNAMLQPLPEHVQQILGAAAGNPTIARRFANGFSDPNDYQHWFMAPDKAAAYLASVSAS